MISIKEFLLVGIMALVLIYTINVVSVMETNNFDKEIARREEANVEYKDCIETAEENFSLNWEYNCGENGPSCALDLILAESIEKNELDAKILCLEIYKLRVK